MVRRYISVVSIRSLTTSLLPMAREACSVWGVRDTLLIPSRYRGPARSANGGGVPGALAPGLGDTFARPVAVRLHQPPPLEASMQLAPDDDGLSLGFGGALVAEASYVEQEIESVEAVSWTEAAAASESYPGLRSHPFPTCFVCGTERDDGLQIFPGEVAPAQEGRTRVAAPWTPDASLAADPAWPPPGPLSTASAGGRATSPSG